MEASKSTITPQTSIRFIIDMDGFALENEGFVCQEMGVIDCKTSTSFSYYFHTIFIFCTLTCKDKKPVKYCTDRVHGLSYDDDDQFKEHELFLQERLYSIFRNLSTEAAITNQLVGFKLGRCEKKMFQRLNLYNYIDIEQWGCPKFEKLLEEYSDGLSTPLLTAHVLK